MKFCYTLQMKQLAGYTMVKKLAYYDPVNK